MLKLKEGKEIWSGISHQNGKTSQCISGTRLVPMRLISSLSTPSSKSRFRIPIWIISLTVLASQTAHSQLGISNNVELLKAFLSNRPPIYRLCFEITDLTASATQGGVEAAKATLYEGGWNTNGYFIQDVLPVLNGTNANGKVVIFRRRFLVGKDGPWFWQVGNSNDVLKAYVPNNETPLGNPVSVHALNQRRLLDEVLNLGVQGMMNGSVIWNQDEFVADFDNGVSKILEFAYFKDGVMVTNKTPKIFGAISRRGAVISELKINEYHSAGPAYLLEFEYDKTYALPFGLPNLITRFVLRNDLKNKTNKTAFQMIRIVGVEAADRQEPKLAFSVSQEQKTYSTNTYNLILSNQQYYAVGENGQLTKLGEIGVEGKALASSASISKRRFAVILFMLSTTLLIVICIRLVSKKNLKIKPKPLK